MSTRILVQMIEPGMRTSKAWQKAGLLPKKAMREIRVERLVVPYRDNVARRHRVTRHVGKAGVSFAVCLTP